MSDREDPFAEIERVFETMTEQFGSGVAGDVAVDLVDEGDRFVLVADLPGYETGDIDLQVSDGRTVHVEASREATRADREGSYLRRERRGKTASRTVTLPEAVDESATEAAYENGVLTVRLPKRTAAGAEGTDIPVS